MNLVDLPPINLGLPPPPSQTPSQTSSQQTLADRFANFGFAIPPETISRWIPATRKILASVVESWEVDGFKFEEIPPLVMPFLKPERGANKQ